MLCAFHGFIMPRAVNYVAAHYDLLVQCHAAFAKERLTMSEKVHDAQLDR